MVRANISSLKKGLVFDMPLTSAWTQSSTVASDRSAYRNHGTATGTPPTFGTTGVTLNGSSDYIDCGNPTQLNFTESNAFSVSAWFNVSPVSGFPQIVSKSAGSNQGYDLFHNNDDTFQVRVKDATNALTINSTATIDGAWHHGVLVYDGANNLTGYLDGESFGTDSSPALSGLDVSASNLQIGYVTKYMDGTVAGVKIWNRALSDTEVAQLYKQGRP